jgi:anti-sigma factor RsiW
MTYSDETLMAHADGELSPDTAARLAADIARDPALAARVAAFAASRQAVADAFPLDPVPDALTARIRALAAASRAPEAAPPPSNVVSLADRRRVPLWQLPAAAAVALTLGLSVALLRGPSPADDAPTLALFDARGLSDALGTVPSGDRVTLPDGSFSVIASFDSGEGELCREFEFDGTDGRSVVSVACRTDSAWEVRFAVATATADDGYAPASSLDALDAWLTASDASAPLDPAAEQAALAALD